MRIYYAAFIFLVAEIWLVIIYKSPAGSAPRKPRAAILTGKRSRKNGQFQMQQFALKQSGFAVVKVDQDKLDVEKYSKILCTNFDFSKCFSVEQYLSAVRKNIPVNRILGQKQVLTAKDALCDTLNLGLGPHVQAYAFQCWVLPRDLKSFQSYVSGENNSTHSLWVTKLVGNGGGVGIRFYNDTKQILERSGREKPEEFVVQPALENPFLLFGKKIDLRVYVLITSVRPARVYICREGLVRRAGHNYTNSATGKFSQLTNVFQSSNVYDKYDDAVLSFESLRKHLGGSLYDAAFERIKLAIVGTVVASEPRFEDIFESTSKAFFCKSCYALLGVDVILDDALEPHVIEMNGLPSMKLSGKGDPFALYAHGRQGSVHWADAMKIKLRIEEELLTAPATHKHKNIRFEKNIANRKAHDVYWEDEAILRMRIEAETITSMQYESGYTVGAIDDYLVRLRHETLPDTSWDLAYPTRRKEPFREIFKFQNRTARWKLHEYLAKHVPE